MPPDIPLIHEISEFERTYNDAPTYQSDEEKKSGGRRKRRGLRWSDVRYPTGCRITLSGVTSLQLLGQRTDEEMKYQALT